MAFILLGLQGDVNNWDSNMTANILDLKGSTLALNYKGSEVRGNKTYISVEAVISRGSTTLARNNIVLVLQHFGEARTNDSNWFSAIFAGFRDMFTSGDYLGLDFSGVTVGSWKPLTLFSREYIDVPQKNFEVSSKNQTKNININASGEWSCSTNVDWIQLSSDGKSLNITVSENIIKKDREAVITLSLSSNPSVNKKLQITQLNTIVDTQLLASFSSATYDKELYNKDGSAVNIGDYTGWKIAYSDQRGKWSEETDFWYQIYENETSNDIVIAFRGTPALSANPAVWGNWIETLTLIAAGSTQMSVHIQNAYVKNEVENGKIGEYLTKNRNVYITGHSLGGHLAIMSYMYIQQAGYDSVVKHVETFNAVGVGAIDFRNINQIGSSKIIQNYTCCDVATWASEARGLKYVGTRKLFMLDKNNKIIDGITGMNEIHTHSNEKTVMVFANPYIKFKNPFDELQTGIDAHKYECFNPLKIQI
jgi:hypothetical protein